jgi:chaperone protein EcpD
MIGRILIHILSMLLVLIFIASTAYADIVITGTRFIYPEKEKEVTIKIDNVGESPALAQVWIDTGNPTASPETASAPFTVTPPINRINAGKGQMLRMIYTGGILPRDKESLFWLNILEIPAASKDKKSQLQLAIHSRLKIFYRPHGLAGTANEAGKAVTWKKVYNGIEGSNTTPYFVSLANIAEDKEGKVVIASGGMIAPGGKIIVPLKKHFATIYPAYISDEGALLSFEQRVAQ